jgi:hypothetical protein
VEVRRSDEIITVFSNAFLRRVFLLKLFAEDCRRRLNERMYRIGCYQIFEN